MVIGQLRQVLVAVGDFEPALALYRDGLGLPLRFRDGSRYAQLEFGGGLTLALVSAPERAGPDRVSLGVRVSDLHTTVAELRRSGWTVVEPPSRGGHELRATLRDPDGTQFVVYRPVA